MRRMHAYATIAAVALLVIAGEIVVGPHPVRAATGYDQVTDSLWWRVFAPSAETAQGATYQLYIGAAFDGATKVPLTGVTCTAITGSTVQWECRATRPAAATPGSTVRLTATNAGMDESLPTPPITIPRPVTATPTDLRYLGSTGSSSGTGDAPKAAR